ncbi:IS607 family transposase [Maribrevibacterium harenarium]|uniref:IS607 family transposase n=1 Tax=Maribrevibacterium harenarium TaxID=2589817 RepID=A0A501WT98_9GAMM|nr:IS607 family transposase [Maribrevibacterium harenarium]TPE49036.1 IS607 family transposase [Maribrevibacterium harenarium]
MKLSDWAKKQGISYRTAWNHFRSGKLPVPARQLPTGTIIVDDVINGTKAVIYARVSSSDQKKDLEGQINRCLNFANSQGIPVSNTVFEIGSGMNGKRKKLLQLLADPEMTHIIVEHRDRLMLFGSEFVEASLSARGVKLVIADQSELTDDLVQDMISVLTSFCARLYGRRSAKNRAHKAMEATKA